MRFRKEGREAAVETGGAAFGEGRALRDGTGGAAPAEAGALDPVVAAGAGMSEGVGGEIRTFLLEGGLLGVAGKTGGTGEVG